MSNYRLAAGLAMARADAAEAKLKSQRNETIEECVRVAEQWAVSSAGGKIGDAIRALKDKP